MRSFIALIAAAGMAFSAVATDISTAADFVSALTADPAGDYTLTDDIDLTGAGYTTIATFSGSLNGSGHTVAGLGANSLFTTLTGTIDNLTVDGRVDGVNTTVSPAAGFAVFATTAQGAAVRNCLVEGYTLNAQSKKVSVAGFFRIVKDGTLISGCTAGSSMIVKSNINVPVGGLVAEVKCTSGYTGAWTARFVACTNLAAVSMAAGNYNENGIGGIVGVVSTAQAGFPRTEFEACVNKTALVGVAYGAVGGIVGLINGTGTANTSGKDNGSDVSFVECVNESAISASGACNYIGGLVGDIGTGSSRTTFTNCLNKAAISAESVVDTTDFVAGLVGHCGDMNHNAKAVLQFVNCANYGNVTGYIAAGLLGYARANDGWGKGNFRFYNSANYGVISELHNRKSGGMYGCFAGSSKTSIEMVMENCWSVCAPLYGADSTRKPSAVVASFTSMDDGYSNAAALTSLNTAVTVDNGYKNWVQGKYYPEFEDIASSPTADKVDVIFRDWDGTSLKTEAVDSGASATPPSDPTREGYAFAGWDKSLENLTSLTLITAVYNIQQYTYQFNTQGGSAVAAITQDYNTQIPAVTNPVRDGYVFKGWALDRALKVTIPSYMTAENRTYYALWKPSSVDNYHSAFTFLQCKSTAAETTSYFSAMNDTLIAIDADIVSFDDFKKESYISKFAVPGSEFVVKSFNGSTDGGARVIGWKTAKFQALTSGMLGTRNSPVSNSSAGYVVLEELSTGNQFMIFNSFAGSTKTINEYNKSISGFLTITNSYPAATTVWGSDAAAQSDRTEFASTYSSDPQKVADEFLSLSGLNAIQRGDDFQWTFTDFTPTSYSVVTNAPDGTFSVKNMYLTRFVLGSNKKTGLVIFVR